MSDGEGNERNWFRLAALIALLRYVTKYHRLVCLNFYAIEGNETLKVNAGGFFTASPKPVYTVKHLFVYKLILKIVKCS